MSLAKWYKIDFHTHTPESKCFRDKKVTPEQWLMAAKKSGLDAVVITDHNSVGYISKIEEAQKNFLEKDKIKVFYGIELCVSADFTHIIIIFDDNNMTVKEIEDAVICDLGLKRDNWSDTEVNVTEDQLKNLCKEHQGKIFVIPAHFASDKGLAKSSINEIKKYKEFVSFHAIEVRNEEDVREYENKLKNKVINKTALITGSDNPSDKDQSIHSIEGFGKAFTWIKVSELNFEGLRQVFIDPEHRCINYLQLNRFGIDYDPNLITHNYISGVKINKFKHIEDINLRFSPYLNCIIGGRGTGKSSIIEAIDFSLDGNRKISESEILSKTLLDDSKIETFFNFGSSKDGEYKVDYTCNLKNQEFKYLNNNGIDENPPKFKIDYYGQKEIYQLVYDIYNESKDKKTKNVKNKILDIIDEMIQSELYDDFDKKDQSLTDLLNLSNKYHDIQNRILELPSIDTEIQKDEKLLSRFQTSGIEEKRKTYDIINKSIALSSKNVNEYLEKLKEYIDNTKLIIKENEKTLNELNINAVLNADAIILVKSIIESCNNVICYLEKEILTVDTGKSKFSSSLIYKKKSEIEKEYLELLEELKAKGIEDIQPVQERLSKNRERYQELNALKVDYDIIKRQIDENIEIYINNCKNLTKKRIGALDKIPTEGFSISLKSLSDTKQWKKDLQDEFEKATFDDEFTKLAEYILDDSNDHNNYKEFLRYILTSESETMSEIFKTKFNAKFFKIWKERMISGTLPVIAKVVPYDKVEITIYDGTNQIDISEGSPGQRCSVLLSFILSTGSNPLILDQPEDDLDNSLTYNLIVKSIRAMKNKRQIIIVTHNPNIPVLGDAEGIVILERDKKGKVAFRKNKKTGCIEEKSIREGICEIMEGGADAFRKREQKYHSTNN